MEQISYTAEATASQFHACDDYVRGLMGPVGSGKSVACVMEIFRRALQQEPHEVRGVHYRKSRWAVIRNTYPELVSTTIKTFQDWIVPEVMAHYSMNPPISCKMKRQLPDGSVLDMEVLFIAIDRADDVKKLLSLELTGAWMNECRELDLEVLEMLTARVGRYPAKRDGGPSWVGIFMDTNPPDDQHWYHDLAEKERPKNYSFFRQPPALVKQGGAYYPNQGQVAGITPAENINNLPTGFDYYLNQIPGKTEEWIKVYVMGEYGTVFSGKSVYPEWIDTFHVAEEPLMPYMGSPITLGWDFGITNNACAIMQLGPSGQLRVLDEILSEDMGITQFAQQGVIPVLQSKYADNEIMSWGDPAGLSRQVTSEKTCMDILSSDPIRISTKPAKTQDPVARREAVAEYLSRLVGREPGFILSPTCTVLRKGFNGGYQFERVNIASSSGGAKYKDKPAKNYYSHIHDALQYGSLMLKPEFRVRKKRTAKPVKKVNFSAWK